MDLIIVKAPINSIDDSDSASGSDPVETFNQCCHALLNRANSVRNLMEVIGHTQHKANLIAAIKQTEYLVEPPYKYLTEHGVTRAEENLGLMRYCLREDVMQQIKTEATFKRRLIQDLVQDLFGLEVNDHV